MKRILLAWELGGGYGHVAIMRGVAQALRELGHECVFAVRELRPAEEYLPPELGTVLQAPRTPIQARSPVRIQTSYASLLHNTGFDDPIDLAGRLRAWIGLLRASRIDAVLANHAPVALLAARAVGLPRGQFGASFVIPPQASPFPGFQPQLQVKDSVLRHNEAEVLRALNQALERLRLSPLEKLQQIFEDCHTRIFGYPELDAYGAASRETGAHMGIADQSYGEVPQWPAMPGPRVLAYLRPFAHLDALMQALQASRLNLLVRISDMSPDKLRAFERPGLTITGRSIHLRQAAEACDAMVHYGPDGTTAEMLLAGKPGLLVPLDVEKVLLTGRAQQLGAVLASGSNDPRQIGQLLERLVEDQDLRRNAEAFAARHRGQDRNAILPAYARDFSRSL
ncbi:glycosyltransferase [Solimonas sp. SE-A11]|uniref:glycosyltransferase n=1 Tax=Solimonas sp. SE-A11 TaxID=3054954 RepID=UPI00259C8144|nr:hypothetical protein [Solimonas sp. SE-A11]MDM4769332.1 hypothetical protein [Solimonas sp. SE-A11]